MDIISVVRAFDESVSLEFINDWLDTPQDALGGRTPRGVICDGRERDVLVLIDEIRQGRQRLFIRGSSTF